MASNQAPQKPPSQDPLKTDQPGTQSSPAGTNRTMMIVVGIIAGLAVIGLVWACLVFFKMI